jgi:hypothetical protein
VEADVHRVLRVLAGVTSLAVVLIMMPTVAVHAVGVPTTLSFRAPVGAGPIVPGFPIDHVGVVWDDPGAAEHADDPVGHGAVRFRTDGSWGAWVPLEKDGASGEGLWASGLVAGGGAEAVQVRGVPVGAGSPRVVAFNTTDGPQRTTRVVAGGAAAIDTKCMSRAEWGADESLRDRKEENFFPAQVMTLHHTATSNGDPDPAGTVRAIYEYHTVDNGWDDIGYNYLISEDGTVFEGVWSGQLGASWQEDTYSQRCSEGGTGADFSHVDAEDRTVVARGAHAGGYNTGNIGIALLGTFTQQGRRYTDPQPAAVSAAEQLLAELSERHGIDPEGLVDYDNGVNPKDGVDAISGHRDFNATECPGDRLYAMLPAIRSDVAALVDTLPDPGDAPPTVTVTAPANGTEVTGTVSLVADAADDTGVTQVEFSVDGAPVGTDSAAADGWSVEWDSVTVENGTHTVSAAATDTAGQTATDSVQVTVDNPVTSTTTMHVGDLDATSTNEGRSWTATVAVSVATSAGGHVDGASVQGAWSTGVQVSCTTGSAGTCTVDLTGLLKRDGSVQFEVTDVTAAPLTYDSSANGDPDGDSDGTTITVLKP